MSYETSLAALRAERAAREADVGFFADFPTAPPAGTEQRALPLERTTEGQFIAWLATRDGARFYVAFCRQLLDDLANGERISAKAAWELARRATHIPANNKYHSLAMRRAEDEYPALRGRAEKRKLTA